MLIALRLVEITVLGSSVLSLWHHGAPEFEFEGHASGITGHIIPVMYIAMSLVIMFNKIQTQNTNADRYSHRYTGRAGVRKRSLPRS
jgi:hypothetical protein